MGPQRDYTLSDVLRALKTERVFDYGFWGEVTIRILLKGLIRRIGAVLVVVALSLIVSIGLACLLLLAPLVAAPHSLYYYWTEILGLFLWANILFNYCMAAFTSPGHPGDEAMQMRHLYSTGGSSGSSNGSVGRPAPPSPRAHTLTLAINRGSWADCEGGRSGVPPSSSYSHSITHNSSSSNSSSSSSSGGSVGGGLYTNSAASDQASASLRQQQQWPGDGQTSEGRSGGGADGAEEAEGREGGEDLEETMGASGASERSRHASMPQRSFGGGGGHGYRVNGGGRYAPSRKYGNPVIGKFSPNKFMGGVTKRSTHIKPYLEAYNRYTTAERRRLRGDPVICFRCHRGGNLCKRE